MKEELILIGNAMWVLCAESARRMLLWINGTAGKTNLILLVLVRMRCDLQAAVQGHLLKDIVDVALDRVG
jgi:hypothetical protein